MSSWGYRTFEDDIACDWLEDLYESEPLAFFRHCLDLRDQDQLSFLACVGVVCTAEMLHAMLCEPRIGLPEAARLWVSEQQRSQESLALLVPIAISALGRVLDTASEMSVRWTDAGPIHYGTWSGELTAMKEELMTVPLGR